MSMQLFGQLLAILAALCGAFSSVIYSRISQKVNSDILAYIRMWIAFPIMALWALFTDGYVLSTVPFSDVLILIISGFTGFFITDLFLFRAYAVYGANGTMVVMCLAPILSTVLSVFLFSETLENIQYLGILLTVVGIAISAFGQVKDKKKLFSYGLICALLAAGIQSLSDMLVKASIADVPYKTSAALRALGGLAGWIVFAVLRFHGKIKNNESLHNLKFLGLFFFTVIIGTIVGTTFAVGSIKYAPAGIVTSLKQISPIFILPYDFFIIKKRSWSSLIGTFVAVGGVALFFV